MKTSNKNSKVIFKSNGLSISTLFDNGKIWLTKKEIAKIHGVDKKIIKQTLKELFYESNIDILENIQKKYNKKLDKNETYYSLDSLILLGYRLKHFDETKYLINTNNIIKKYHNDRKNRLDILRPVKIVKNILNNINPLFN